MRTSDIRPVGQKQGRQSVVASSLLSFLLPPPPCYLFSSAVTEGPCSEVSEVMFLCSEPSEQIHYPQGGPWLLSTPILSPSSTFIPFQLCCPGPDSTGLPHFPQVQGRGPIFLKEKLDKIGILSENVSQTRERSDELPSVQRTYWVLNFLEFWLLDSILSWA